MPNTRPLTANQREFARQYLVDLNAAQAAQRAGYSTRSARQVGHELLKDERVQALMADEMGRRAARVQDSMDEVLRDLRRLGQKAESLCEFTAAIKAIELRGKHLGMFKDRLEHSGPEGGPIPVAVTRVELVPLLPDDDGADPAAA